MTRHARLLSTIVVVLTVAPLVSWIVRTRGLEPVLGWDQAEYFRMGQEILLYARARDWAGLERACREMVHYPPGFGLALAAWLGATQPTHWWATTFNLALLGGCTALLWVVCWRHGSPLAGVLSGALLLSSPTVVAHAGDVLLEVPGVFLTLAFVTLYFARPSLDAPFSSRGERARTGAVLLLAALTKHHLPVLLIAATLTLAVLDLIDAARQGRLRDAGRRFLTVAVFVGEWTVLPMSAWLLWIGSDGRAAFVRFFTVDRSSWTQVSPSALLHWSYYLWAIVERAFQSSAIGLLVVGLAGLGVLRRGSLARPAQWALCYVAITLVGFSLYPPRIDRYVLGAIPLLCLVAGWEAAQILASPRLSAWHSTVALAAAVLGAAMALRCADAGVAATVGRHRLFAAWANPAYEFVGRHLSQARDARRVSIAGTSVLLSEGAITSLAEDVLGRPTTPEFSLDRLRAAVPKPQAEFDEWLEVREPGQVLITVEVLPSSPLFDDDYRRFNATRTWAIPLAAATPRLVKTERLETPSGLRLTSWRLLPFSRAASP